MARVLENAILDDRFFVRMFSLPDIHRDFKVYLNRGEEISDLDAMSVLPLMARMTSCLGLGKHWPPRFNSPNYEMPPGITLASIQAPINARGFDVMFRPIQTLIAMSPTEFVYGLRGYRRGRFPPRGLDNPVEERTRRFLRMVYKVEAEVQNNGVAS